MKLAEIVEHGATFQFADDPCAAVMMQSSEQSCSILTYRAAWQALVAHKAWLQQQVVASTDCAVNKTVVVAYLSANSIDMLLAILAGTSVDSVTVALLNTRWTASEMALALQTSDRTSSTKTLILHGPSFEEAAKEACNLLEHPAWTLAIPTYARARMTLLTSVSAPARPQVYRDDKEIDCAIRNAADNRDGNGDQDDALIVFTSGTTSGSKGVRLSHTALYVQALAKLRQPCGYSNQTRMLASTVPLFHVGGLSSTLSVLLAGGTWVLPAAAAAGSAMSSTFDPTLVLESITSPIISANTLVVVPTMLHSILQQALASEGYPAVRLLLIGGQSASPETLRRVARVFPNARLVQTFACTEAASSLTFLDIQRTTAPFATMTEEALPSMSNGDCVGVPPPHVELVLVDKTKAGSISLIDGAFQTGLFATRGPHVMSGYWNRGALLDDHASRIARGSWYVTSDIGFRDERGRFYFCGRAKDIIRTGGETVIALEVERVLLRNEHVQECAVFALPDEKFGEVVCAALVCTNGEVFSLPDLRDFCAQQGLAGYKKPRRVFYVKGLPRNSSGKVQKHKLVEGFRDGPTLQSKL